MGLEELVQEIIKTFSLRTSGEAELVTFTKRNSGNKSHVAELLKILKNVFMTPKMTLNGRTLEISGRQIVLSKELEKIQQRNYLSKIDQVNFAAASRIYVDCKMSSSDWHGKNVAIGASSVIVFPGVEINVSGKSAKEFEKSKADPPTIRGRSGDHGQDGEAGESSGNVYINTEAIIGTLTVKANGGKGADGQSGADGMRWRMG